jgi:hypothetical protein
LQALWAIGFTGTVCVAPSDNELWVIDFTRYTLPSSLNYAIIIFLNWDAAKRIDEQVLVKPVIISLYFVIRRLRAEMWLIQRLYFVIQRISAEENSELYALKPVMNSIGPMHIWSSPR